MPPLVSFKNPSHSHFNLLLQYTSLLFSINNTCRKSVTMGLNAQDSGEGYLQSSRCLDVHHLGSSAQVAPMPTTSKSNWCHLCLIHD